MFIHFAGGKKMGDPYLFPRIWSMSIQELFD